MNHCAICNLTVTDHDPERKVHQGKVYHESCILRNIRHRAQEEIRQVQQLQVVWNGREPLSRLVQ